MPDLRTYPSWGLSGTCLVLFSEQGTGIIGMRGKDGLAETVPDAAPQAFDETGFQVCQDAEEAYRLCQVAFDLLPPTVPLP